MRSASTTNSHGCIQIDSCRTSCTQVDLGTHADAVPWAYIRDLRVAATCQCPRCCTVCSVGVPLDFNVRSELQQMAAGAGLPYDTFNNTIVEVRLPAAFITLQATPLRAARACCYV